MALLVYDDEKMSLEVYDEVDNAIRWLNKYKDGVPLQYNNTFGVVKDWKPITELSVLLRLLADDGEIRVQPKVRRKNK